MCDQLLVLVNVCFGDDSVDCLIIENFFGCCYYWVG